MKKLIITTLPAAAAVAALLVGKSAENERNRLNM